MYGGGDRDAYRHSSSNSRWSLGSYHSSAGDSEGEELDGAVAVEIWKAGKLILGPVVSSARSSEVISRSHEWSSSHWGYTKRGNYYSDSNWNGYQNWTDREWLYYHLIEKCISRF